MSEEAAAEEEAAVVASVELDPEEWRSHLLTDAEQQAFSRDGETTLASFH